MGLGTVNKNNGLYLTIAGGFIWNRKADKSDPNYAEQKWKDHEGNEKVRSGAQYADLTGKVVDVQFRVHDKYGENINVTIEDEDKDRYILSISTNNRYSQDLMKMLLKVDLSKDVFIKPYDFIGEDNKRAMGISFRQDGEKIALRNDDAPQYEGEWTNKKKVKRYFEDLTEWFVEEIEANIVPQFKDSSTKQETYDSGSHEEQPVKKEKKQIEEPVKKETPKVTPMKMKKFLKAYIEENYDDKELPKLSREELVEWYELAYNDEELPFDEEVDQASEKDISEQLDNLLDN